MQSISNTPRITVGIPTFNRSGAVIRTLSNIFEQALKFKPPTKLSIIVSDNASEDDTQVSLAEFAKTSVHESVNLVIVRNNSNLGFQGNLHRLLAECKTSYLMLWSDEDYCDISGLIRLERVLKNDPVAFAAPQLYRNGNRYRGRGFKRNILIPEVHNASGYVSGLTMSVAHVRSHQDLFESANTFSPESAYPQTEILQALIADRHRALWMPVRVGEVNQALPTQIRTQSGYGLDSIEGRIEQARREEAWLAHLSREPTRKSTVEKMRRWAVRQHSQTLVRTLTQDTSPLLRESAKQLRLPLAAYPGELWRKVARRLL